VSAFAFADHGRNIEVAEADDRAAALAALQLGAAKWGGKVTIYGSPEYQAMCVQLAVENGIEIVNPELREQFQAAKEAHRRARRKPCGRTRRNSSRATTRPCRQIATRSPASR
jgi:hypothetical protein